MRNISTAIFAPFVQALAQNGIQEDVIYRHLHDLVGLDISTLPRVELAAVYKILNLAVELTGNPEIGLDAYRYSHLGSLGAAGYAIMSSPTLGIAIERVATYHPLATDGSRITVERHPGEICVSGFEEGMPHLPAPRSFLDAGAALFIGLMHWLVPHVKPLPLAAHFPYPEPANTQRLKQMFGPDLSFNAPHVMLVFSSEIFDLPLITADPGLELIHCHYADAQLRAINGSPELQIRRYLSDAMPRGELCTLEMAAAHIGKSARSLQNALEKQGTNFTYLQDECRRLLARTLLLDSSRSLKYIALTVGFRELSSFHKACLRWFGASPAQFREAKHIQL